MLLTAIFTFLSIIILCSFYIYYRRNKAQRKTAYAYDRSRGKKLVILWDIHGVLFEKSFFRWLYIMITFPHLLSLLKKLDKNTVIILLKYCGKKMKILKEEVTNQELINYAQKVRNDALINLTMQVSCAYKPKSETIALVEKLHEHGYAQHIGSNIGKAIFELFAPQHPTIFSYFSYVHIIDTQQITTIIKKPNKEFFLSYLHIHQKYPQDVLFIDDRWANIKTARTCGLQTIYFKNSIQLKKEMERLGLF
jgi:FMN phosphatase YigB (HAD superfamily)